MDIATTACLFPLFKLKNLLILIKLLKTVIQPITQKGAKENVIRWNIRSGVAAPDK